MKRWEAVELAEVVCVDNMGACVFDLTDDGPTIYGLKLTGRKAEGEPYERVFALSLRDVTRLVTLVTMTAAEKGEARPMAEYLLERIRQLGGPTN